MDHNTHSISGKLSRPSRLRLDRGYRDGEWAGLCFSFTVALIIQLTRDIDQVVIVDTWITSLTLTIRFPLPVSGKGIDYFSRSNQRVALSIPLQFEALSRSCGYSAWRICKICVD